jgi:hypothetical protein
MTRVLAVIGLLGAGALAAIAFTGQAPWGPPGSAAYTMYELMNRLTGAGLLLMAAAPLALRRALDERSIRAGRRALAVVAAGTVAMAIGSAAEFIVFTTAPYSGPGSEVRNLSWLTFLAGGFVTLVATVAAGFILLRDARVQRPIALCVIAAVPVGFIAAYLGLTALMAIPLMGLVLGVAAVALRPSSRYSE